MKRYTGPAAIVVAALALSLVLFPAVAPAAVHVPFAGSLTPLTFSLPAAKSGERYLWTLRAEGCVGGCVCVPQALHVGSLALTAGCQIIGTAPVVEDRSDTGPFYFKMSDHSIPPKTATL